MSSVGCCARNRQTRVVNLDALTYAGTSSNLRDVEAHERYTFVKGDIRDADIGEPPFSTEHASTG